MKPTIHFPVLLCAILFPVLNAVAQNWQLVWQDEFTNGIGPDWVFETGNGTNGWGNNELQYYQAQNATTQNGELVITARHETAGTYNYTSARMKTQGRKSWKYGKVEARIAMPGFQGVWPAFWMLGDNIGSAGWPACGEIDIMEHINAENKNYGTMHWKNNNNQYASYSGNTPVNVTEYHVYAIEWTPSAIKWFVDGVQYHEANITNGINGTEELHNNFFIILNMAIGGNWPGFTVDTAALPASMNVDYVRVYQQTDIPYTLLIQAENYGIMSGVQTQACSDTSGGLNVTAIDTRDWMTWYSVNFPTTGSYMVEYRVASAAGGGRLSLDLNAGSIQLGALNIPATGGAQNWTTISHTVNVNAGIYNLGIYAQAGGWNLNWIRITRLSSAPRKAVNETDNDNIQQKDELAGFHLFPNPVNNELRISHAESLAGGLLAIYDATGRQVFTSSQPENNMNVSKLTAGIYTLMYTKNGKHTIRRFVK